MPLLLLAFVASSVAEASSIRDYQEHLNPQFAKRRRQDTRFIVIHSTECSLTSALRTLSKGKVRSGRRVTRGGHAHYLLARSGTIYRILDPTYRADHAGVSMWNGVEDLSDHSLGIELEGFHDVPFSEAQYRSLRWLLNVLRRRFRVASRDVLEHYRIAYARPNRFHSRTSRGRKLDPGVDNFDRRRAGLTDEYAFDPDVAAGRIGRLPDRRGHTRTTVEAGVRRRLRGPSGVITRRRSAWSIAGRQYGAETTLYVLPDGTARRGNTIADWARIPAGTRLYTNVPHAPRVPGADALSGGTWP